MSRELGKEAGITDRLCLLENNYGRALALLEDKIRDLECEIQRLGALIEGADHED